MPASRDPGRCVASPVMTAPDSPTRSPLTGVTVLDAMNPGVVSCLPDDGVAKLASIMVAHGIHAVVLARGDPTGPLIVTDLELVQGDRAGASRCARRRDRARAVGQPPRRCTARSGGRDDGRAVHHPSARHRSGLGRSGRDRSQLRCRGCGGRSGPEVRTNAAARACAGVGERGRWPRRAGDAMHPGVTTCPADAPLTTVALSMAEHRIDCVAVAGIEPSDHHLKWGLIGDMDLVLAVHRGAFSEPAATIAATEPIAVLEDDSLERVAALMVEHATSHLVVVARSGLPSGIVSTRDVAGVFWPRPPTRSSASCQTGSVPRPLTRDWNRTHSELTKPSSPRHGTSPSTPSLPPSSSPRRIPRRTAVSPDQSQRRPFRPTSITEAFSRCSLGRESCRAP